MKIFKNHRKAAVSSLALVVALLGGGVAFAYFTSTGSGTGSASVGTASNVTITQGVGAYDSLSVSGVYHQDQTYGGTQTSEFGNEIQLSSAGQLSNVVVAMSNWGPDYFTAPITLNIYHPGATARTVGSLIATDTQSFSFVPASPSGRPSESTITFDFTSQNLMLPATPIVYGIAYPPSGATAGLNVALSSSGSDITAGTDPMPGYVFVNTGSLAGWESDAGVCPTSDPTLNVFSAAYVWCGNTPPANLGAYGSSAGYDIPAVEFNVGGIPTLYPNVPPQTIYYTVSNPGTIPVFVGQVTVTLASIGGAGGNTNIDACSIGEFPIAQGSPINLTIPAGGSAVGTATISMPDNGRNQGNCQGVQLHLSFSS